MPHSSAVMFGSFVNPIGLQNLDWKYLIVYVVWLCFEVVFIYFFFPETFGKTLEELTFLFESESEKREELNATAVKAGVVGGGAAGEGVTEVYEVPEKKV